MCIYMHTMYIQTCVYMYNDKKKMNLRGRRGPKVMLNAVLIYEVLKNKNKKDKFSSTL